MFDIPASWPDLLDDLSADEESILKNYILSVTSW